MEKGIITPRVENEPADSAARAGMVREIRTGLRARWVRIIVDWQALEPTRGGAGRYFDVYSHHPYTPGGSMYAAPDQPPNDRSRNAWRATDDGLLFALLRYHY